jgi:DNA-directed RNA polymerase specialized sigma24 family protein
MNELETANHCLPVGPTGPLLSMRPDARSRSKDVAQAAEHGAARLGKLPNRFPLLPHPTASLECLLDRLHPIHELLLRRRFTDAVASQAVDMVLDVGRNALSSGKAAQMRDEHRVAWLWKVALNAARRAAVIEPTFVSLQWEPEHVNSEGHEEQRELFLEILRNEIGKLAPKQQRAVELHGLQGLSLRQAARLIGVHPETVAYRYKGGIKGLVSAVKGEARRLMARNSPPI